jgi:hyperosmotically inducible protein
MHRPVDEGRQWGGLVSIIFAQEVPLMRYMNSLKHAAAAIAIASATIAHAQDSGSEVEPTVQASTANPKQLKEENRRLQKTVLRSLSYTKGLSVSNILAVARNGVVTLAGSVPEDSQIELAVSTAKGVAGVIEVKSDLVIRPTDIRYGFLW